MAIDIKFDLVGNPEPPTIILATRNGNKLGQLKVNEDSIELIDKLNDASEISFTVNKYIDGEITPLWDKLVDFKTVYCKEWDLWFEITVELDEETETVKTVFGTQLGQAELSQIMLYNIEINTEKDIERDDYKISILYDENDPKSSILNRMLEKAPHYSIHYVDPTIKNIQRSFSFDGTSIYDAFQDIAEEIGCLFVFHSNSGENGKIQRVISVYDLQQNCLNPDCRHRGEFTDVCPKCGGTNIDYNENIFKDTLIFVTADELASGGIELTTDTDSVKNCFKLEAGDDLMTATIRNCNPNGTDYIWYFSDDIKEDMSDELVKKIESYNVRYSEYYNSYKTNIDNSLLSEYNALVNKYSDYNEDLQNITSPIVGYPNLMNAYYNTIDLGLYLKSELMPSIEMSDTNAEEQASLLRTASLSPVAVNTDHVEAISLATANSAVLSMAKIVIRSTYKIEVNTSTISDIADGKLWKGDFRITNYSDEEDTAISEVIMVKVNNDAETFIKQKLDKSLNKENTDDLSISGLFKKDYDEFCAELKKYALNPLKSFYDACDSCLNILIDQGAADKNKNSDLYDNLYKPYYDKSSAISEEIKLREREIAIIEGVYDNTDEDNAVLISKGLQSNIEEHRNKIRDALDFEKYLGETLWLEFCAYRREDTYSNDNYISDGLNNAEIFKRASEFIETAENEIYKSSELQHSISTSLNNLLTINKFKPLVDSFSVGNWIRVQVDDKIFKLRLLEYEISFGNFKDIPVKFSDVIKIKNGITDVKSIFEQVSSMATNYSSIQRQANQGDKAKDTIEQWVSNGLNAALVQIQSNDNEEVTMNKDGLLCRSFDDITGEYLPEQLKITHNIMAYTDDNWQTVKQAIGKHNYKVFDKTAGEMSDSVGYGMSAEFVTAGVVSGSQIIGGDIYSDNYSDANKTGSYINLTNGTFSFAGGSLRYDGGDLLISSPNVLTKNELTEINESYLRTTTVYAENLQVNSAKIQGKLTASQINADGISAKDVNLTGNITATDGNIGGWTIKEHKIYAGDGTTVKTAVMQAPTESANWVFAAGGSSHNSYADCPFRVNKDGSLYATNATISGNITATDGNIGGWEIDENIIGLKTGNSLDCFFMARNGETVWLDAAGAYTNCVLDLGGNFGVDVNGKMYAKNAQISGNISATSGNFSNSVTIGGTEITAGALKDLYSYATGGTGTPITQINATVGEISGLKIDSSQNRLYYEYGSDNYTTLGLSSIEIVRGEKGWFRVGLLDGENEPLSIVMGSGKNALYIGSSSAGLIGTWSLNDSVIQTSDKNSKNSIEPLSEKYSVLFDNIVPVRFKYNHGTSNRYHTGFIAQELQKAIINADLSEQEVAALCTIEKENKNEKYMGIRYDELISLCVNEIQKLKKQVKELKNFENI